MLGKENYWKGIGLKFAKSQKKRLFPLRRCAPLHYNKFPLGQKYIHQIKKGGGGKNMNFKFNIHPWNTVEDGTGKVLEPNKDGVNIIPSTAVAKEEMTETKSKKDKKDPKKDWSTSNSVTILKRVSPKAGE